MAHTLRNILHVNTSIAQVSGKRMACPCARDSLFPSKDVLTDHKQPFANILVFLLNASMLLLCGLSSFKNLRKDQRPFLRLGTNVINDILQWLNDRDDYLCSILTAFCSLLAFETENIFRKQAPKTTSILY